MGNWATGQIQTAYPSALLMIYTYTCYLVIYYLVLDLHPRSQNPKLSKDKHLPSFSLAPPPTSYLISRHSHNHTVNSGKAGLLNNPNSFLKDKPSHRFS
ncbi:hypothetical protein EYC84_001733 [Monilinia fructicola]|uniref:Uncharacterized protein n=1 Tax=Monilinia fructicola TaxID=38448 RepID=A0A5M9JR66_MONFR|nr:hypothetical protein EYC84_001733 [Monilinia fructicola]